MTTIYQGRKFAQGAAGNSRQSTDILPSEMEKLMGLLHIITSIVAGSRGMFTHMQHALTVAQGCHIMLLSAVHYKINA